MMHFIQQASAQCPGRAGEGTIFFFKSARLHDRHRQRVTHHQGIDGAGGRRKVHRAGFAFYGDIQHRFCRQAQR